MPASDAALTGKLGFRPDLEGLRAVAVVLVLLYHARVPPFGGGYVGVDVFFVLSGFLITGIIVRELGATGRVSLIGFYARRARRLLPAAALVLVVTMLASAVVLSPIRVGDVAVDVTSAALYVSNIRFALQATDYLGSALPPSPVLHFWSLSVEEQFYFLWPTLLVAAAGATFLQGRAETGVRRLAILLGAVFVLSLILSIWLTNVDQPWAFFSLPTRAWELALGGLLALPGSGRVVRERLRTPMTWAGLALIVVAGVAFDEQTAFPGVAALVPTVGSALVIAAGLATVSQPGSRYAPARILSMPPMRFLGRISYSLYLWHWPILVLAAAAASSPLRLAVRLALVGLAIVAATATQRWIEDPMRRGKWVGLKPRRSVVGAAALTMAVVILSMSLGRQAGLAQPVGVALGGSLSDVPLPTDSPVLSASAGAGGSSDGQTDPSPVSTPGPLVGGPVPPDIAPALTAARGDLPPIYEDGCHLDVPSTIPAECAFGDARAQTRVVLFGDSHAAQWFPALERLATERDWRLESMTKSACTTADIPVWNSIVKRAYDECDQWREAVLARLANEHPDLVVVSDSRGYETIVNGTRVPAEQVQAQWDAASARTLGRLAKVARNVLVIGDTPRAQADPPECLSAHPDNATACAVPYARAVDPAWTAHEAAVSASAGVGFVDPTAWVCRTDPCPAVVGRFLIFRDQHHLTATYARALAERLYARLPSLVP